MRSLAWVLKATAFLFVFAPLACAQTWPVRPVRVIVNTAAGGPVDTVARIFAPQLGEALGQPIVIENRAGAAGNIGMETAAKATPDGYTLLMTSGSPIVVGPHLYELSIDVGRDLVPVAATVRATQMLVVRPDMPVRSVADLIAYGRNNPGKLNYGSPGNGSVLHIYAELLSRSAKIAATHVPYKGAAPALADLLAGRLDFLFDPGGAKAHIKTGKVRLLAVVLAERTPSFPDTPTMAEAGVDLGADPLYGVYAPAGTPRDIVMRLNREISRIMQTARARAALEPLGAQVFTTSPEEFATLMHRDRERFGAYVRDLNIRVQ